MNERIKQLCEQSKVYANESTKDFTGDEPVVWMDYYTEKFAQLIVRDVLVICGAVSEPFGDPEMDKNIPGALVVAEMIRENFGVEE